MTKKKYFITGMTCASCSSRVERALTKLEGMKECSVNLLKNTALCTFDEDKISEDDIKKAVVDAGYGIIIEEKKKEGANRERTSQAAKREEEGMKKRLVYSFIFTIPLFYISMGHMMNWPFLSFFRLKENSMVFALTLFILSLPVLIINRKFFISGFKALRNKSPNMDSLIALGSGASMVYGIYALYKIAFFLGQGDLESAHNFSMDLYFESAAMILTLITLGKYFESRAKGKTSKALERLVDLKPKSAVIKTESGEMEIKADEIKVGDIAVLRTGSAVPSDGVIIKGEIAVDESQLTGESIPVDKKEGDRVTGASLIASGYAEMRVEKTGEDTALSRIIALVDEATASKAPIAKMADKVSAVFVPAVILISIISLFSWLLSGASLEFSLSFAISVLVISCPCALGLATPTAIMVATGRAARSGILIKNAESLEALHSVDTVLLDKTGTITNGRPELRKIIRAKEIDEKALLKYAYSAEKNSEHPLAMAVARYASARGIELLPSSSFMQSAGSGVSAIVNNKKVEIGNRRMLERLGLYKKKIKEIEESLSDDALTPLFVLIDGTLCGILALSDEIKSSSVSAIERLKKDNLTTVMITGDNARTAEVIGKKAKVDRIISEVLPDEKEAEVRRLLEQGKKTLMVGDGINDSPALARSTVGAAIGRGTDVAIESADIVLMKSDLSDVANAIELSRATMRNIKENLFWALFYNALCIPVAAGALYPAFGIKLSPMIAAFAMSFSSVFVVTNALRLRLFKTENTANAACQITDAGYAESVEMDIMEKGEEGDNMKAELLIEGMMCMHCVKHVDEALRKCSGVESVEVSLEDKKALVSGSELNESELVEAVVNAGYEVKGYESR
ncbi:MAG TPA: heavy metal translocating P-type ATPase [Candidatus Ornithospirochaeta avicola]|uniref:P-type Cu(2+) transporter n=1 Tax=Candidatus Ornithospirochaeta avicola TaxID=2840896 RepID=A0A9D1TMD5_9SPIO|nr:heavy metal translocating P-type ATPase [Candidatus Ornithospirochaeta avicola]